MTEKSESPAFSTNDLATIIKKAQKEENRKAVSERKPSFVISSLPQFALNDILHLLTNFPNLVYEIDTLMDQNDMVHYLESIRKICPKSQSCLNIIEDFLEEFKKNKIRDYIFDFLVNFNYFRVEDQVYEVTDDLKKNFKKFFTLLEDHIPFSALEFNKEDLKFPSNLKFLIFKNPEKDLIDIRILETYLKKTK